MLDPDNISPAVVVMGKMLSALMPRFGLIELEKVGVVRDPNVMQAYMNNPFVYKGKTTARLAADLLKGMQRVRAEAVKIAFSFHAILCMQQDNPRFCFQPTLFITIERDTR
jgi:hypothetical protein